MQKAQSKASINSETASPLSHLSSKDKGSKYSGRYVELKLPSKGITFRFNNDSKKLLKEIIIDDLDGIKK